MRQASWRDVDGVVMRVVVSERGLLSLERGLCVSALVRRPGNDGLAELVVLMRLIGWVVRRGLLIFLDVPFSPELWRPLLR